MIDATNNRGLAHARSPGRSDMQPNQVTRLFVGNIDDETLTLLWQSDDLYQSPNWTADGRWIVFNGLGDLWRLPVEGAAIPDKVEITTEVGYINNDHVVSPDGRRIYFSADGHLYCVPVAGGAARRISNDQPAAMLPYSCWLHGISADEQWLAYTSRQPEGDNPFGRRNIVLIPTAGGQDRMVTEGATANQYNGSEFSRDGQWIYYNSEEAATISGHAQIFRMRLDGTGRQRLTFDDRVNWFPHLTPDGTALLYQSYPPGTTGHPADMAIELRLLPAEGGMPRTVAKLFGGQGTNNCNSWAPDGRQFAFFAYPSTIEG